jgi:hypothetical protein
VGVRISDGAAEPLSVSAPARASGIYNHAIAPLTVSGGDTDGDPVTLSASNVPAGLTFNASTGTLSGSPKVPAGEYVVTFAASDGNGETVTRRLRLTVEPASCLLTDKAASFASKSPAALTAKLTEPVTKAAIVKREVQFTAVASQTREAGTPFSALTSSTGVAKVKAPLAAGEVYLVTAAFPGDADYLPCAAPANEIVSVAPSTYVSAGAGTIAIGKAISSFGYSAVQATEGGNPLVLITPAGELSAGVITSISKPTSTSATWTGTGGWNGANAEYTATAVDPGTGADTLEITVTVEGTVVFSSEGPRAVKGGDVKVH